MKQIVAIDNRKMLALVGDAGDRVVFSEYIQKNLTLFRLRNSFESSTHSAAHFIRKELAEALRKGPYQCDMLIAGYDDDCGPSLYYLDYMAALRPMKYAVQGAAGTFSDAIFDEQWKVYENISIINQENLSIEEAKSLLKTCVHALYTRSFINETNFITKIVDKNGIREIDSQFLGVHPNV